MMLFAMILACSSAPESASKSHDHAAHDEHKGQEKAKGHEGHGDHEKKAGHEKHGKGGLHLKLNDGERWMMDDHTREVMLEIQSNLSSADPKTVDEGKALAKLIDSQMTTLISGCTMSGPAHDELHGFLEAFFPALKALETAKDGHGVQASTKKLKSLVTEYSKFFK